MSVWVNFCNNPRGRMVGDCVTRAISKALDKSWKDAYLLIASKGYALADMPTSNMVWGQVLEDYGFKRHSLPDTCPTCYTIGDFADDHLNGMYVVGTGNHVVTIVDGQIFDSWDSRNETALYYWSKEE